MPDNDPTDAKSIPPEARSVVRNAVMIAVETVLAERGYYLDLFGRFELLDLILDEAEEAFDRETPSVREN